MKKSSIVSIIVIAIIAIPLYFAIGQDGKGKGQDGGKGKGKGGEARPQGGGGKGGGGFQPPSFGDIDTDKSGDINKEEWIAHSVKAAKERAERSFGFMAGDDGKISEEELQRVMQRFGKGGRGGSSGMKGGGGDAKGKGGGKGKGKGKGDAGGGDDSGATKPKRPAIEE